MALVISSTKQQKGHNSLMHLNCPNVEISFRFTERMFPSISDNSISSSERQDIRITQGLKFSHQLRVLIIFQGWVIGSFGCGRDCDEQPEWMQREIPPHANGWTLWVAMGDNQFFNWMNNFFEWIKLKFLEWIFSLND